MKAFIFNSGTGSRMGDITLTKPKALVPLVNGETLLSRQIRLLKKAGINDFVISTGPFPEQIIDLCGQFPGLHFEFVQNPNFKTTNSIYSLYLAKSFLNDNVIVIHGDLVFDSLIVEKVINSQNANLCLINTHSVLPVKDFKGRIIDSKLQEISVDIFDKNCFALQPLYKVSYSALRAWFKEIDYFVERKETHVYAELALNNILKVFPFSYFDFSTHFIEEVDNQEDLTKVNSQLSSVDYRNQLIIFSDDYLSKIRQFIQEFRSTKPFFIHGKHFLKDLSFTNFLIDINASSFSGYSPNPTYEDVLNGLKIFNDQQCDSIIALSGGSGIDVAKAIKLYYPFKEDFIHQIPQYVGLPLLAIPTTAGTGSESTRYSVIYFQGEKQSLSHDCLLPDVAVLSPSLLNDLPDYQKKSALLDALCQAIESYWSIHSTEASQKYARDAIQLILDNYIEYIHGNQIVYSSIMKASNLAGRAINITQTTAPHAMSYKLTSLTGIAHGHAVSIILPEVLNYMMNHLEESQDSRGQIYLQRMFHALADLFKVSNLLLLGKSIQIVFDSFNLSKPKISENDITSLVKSVNILRLRNNPVLLNTQSIKNIYNNIFLTK